MNVILNRSVVIKARRIAPLGALLWVPFLCLFFSLLASPAFALLEVQTVTPDSTEDTGMTVRYYRSKDGTYTFTVTRFPSRELLSWPGAGLADMDFHDTSELEIRTADQSGDSSKTKLLAKTRVAAEVQGGNRVYVFSLARECIAYSRFTVYENLQHKDATKPRRHGGSMFEINLAAIDQRLKATVPQHP